MLLCYVRHFETVEKTCCILGQFWIIPIIWKWFPFDRLQKIFDHPDCPDINACDPGNRDCPRLSPNSFGAFPYDRLSSPEHILRWSGRLYGNQLKNTEHLGLCFWLSLSISLDMGRIPLNPYITGKLIKFSNEYITYICKNRYCKWESTCCFSSKIFLHEVPSHSNFTFCYQLLPYQLQQGVYINTVSVIFICSSQLSFIISSWYGKVLSREANKNDP